jgi:hypothetical protein
MITKYGKAILTRRLFLQSTAAGLFTAPLAHVLMSEYDAESRKILRLKARQAIQGYRFEGPMRIYTAPDSRLIRCWIPDGSIILAQPFQGLKKYSAHLDFCNGTVQLSMLEPGPLQQKITLDSTFTLTVNYDYKIIIEDQ